MIFSVLKRRWTDERDTHKRDKGSAVTKSNFLAVYARAHVRALTPENILAAFRKTGVVPLDPDMVTTQMMAPSLETARSGALPLPISAEVEAVSSYMKQEIDRRNGVPVINRDLDIGMELEEDTHHDMHFNTTDAASEHLINDIASTSSGYLVSSSPMRAHFPPPTYKPMVISSIKYKSHYSHLLERAPKTEEEAELQAALRESEERDNARKNLIVGMQATVVLQDRYVDRAQGHLQEAEEAKKNKKSTRPMGDGLAKLLDGDEFFDRVTEWETQWEKITNDKAKKKSSREMHSIALQRWKRLEEQRKGRNKEKREKHEETVKAWEHDRDLAKVEKRRLTQRKPKAPAYEKPTPRPKKDAFALNEGAEIDDEGSDGQDEDFRRGTDDDEDEGVDEDEVRGESGSVMGDD